MVGPERIPSEIAPTEYIPSDCGHIAITNVLSAAEVYHNFVGDVIWLETSTNSGFSVMRWAAMFYKFNKTWGA